MDHMLIVPDVRWHKLPRCEPDDPDTCDAPAGRTSTETPPVRQPSGRGATRGKGTFRQRDVYAAIRAVERAGKQVSRVEIDSTTGTIRLVLGDDAAAEEPGVNEWDVVLK
jgi:hypothetical protein